MRLLMVEDDELFGGALHKALLRAGYAADWIRLGADLMAAMRTAEYDCVLLDLNLPDSTGEASLRSIRGRSPGLSVIVITAHGDVAAARQAFLADAVDFIEKPFDGEQLLAAIETALSGLRTAASPQEPVARSSPATPLSAREREVMSLMVKGLHNRRIAEALGISPRTVEVHKARVMEKLGVKNLVDLVRLVDQGRA